MPVPANLPTEVRYLARHTSSQLAICYSYNAGKSSLNPYPCWFIFTT
jgi:hypothetical protein